jgi:VWFA-related protein
MSRYLQLILLLSSGVGAVFGLGVALLSAQQQEPTFRTVTRLVEVSITVLDKKGNAVAGLEPADFVLLDEGKPRPVELFRFDGGRQAGAAGASAAILAPGTFTNLPSANDNAPRNVAALVLDSINTPPEQSTAARGQMMRYLRTLAPQTVVAVFLMGGQLHILHDFTDDAASLRARLEKVTLGMPLASLTDLTLEAQRFIEMFRDDPAMLEIAREMVGAEAVANGAARRYRMERSLAEMEALGTHLAGIPGRKSLVWIGGGFSMVVGDMGTTRRGSVDTFEEKVRQVSRRLAQQGIVLYVVDSKGIESPGNTLAASRASQPNLSSPSPTRSMELDAVADAITSDPYAAMELMASITGGRFLQNTNDLTSGFKQVAADLQGSYALGFYMPEDPDKKWHKLRVRVRRSGLNVRHREGYLADSQSAPAKWTEEMWRTSFSNPIGSSAIPLTAKCQWTPLGELELTVLAAAGALQFLPDGENLKANLEILIGDRAADGLARGSRSTVSTTVPPGQWEAARHQEIRYNRTWKPAANTTALRVIAYDENSGKYGSLDVPLSKVPRDNPN